MQDPSFTGLHYLHFGSFAMSILMNVCGHPQYSTCWPQIANANSMRSQKVAPCICASGFPVSALGPLDPFADVRDRWPYISYMHVGCCLWCSPRKASPPQLPSQSVSSSATSVPWSRDRPAATLTVVLRPVLSQQFPCACPNSPLPTRCTQKSSSPCIRAAVCRNEEIGR